MSLFSLFSLLTFVSTYAGIFFLRVFHYGFIYETPAAIVLESVPTVVISFFLIVTVILVERPILRRFSDIIEKAGREALTDGDIEDCRNCYKKYDIAIAIGDAVGFILGTSSTAIIGAVKGTAPFSLPVFIIIEMQGIGMGFLCYTLNVFLIKRLIMTRAMQEAGIEVSGNLSHTLSVAVGTCVYLSAMNMITVPIGVIMHPREDGFVRFLIYAVIGGVLNTIVCFLIYSLIIKRIQTTEQDVSRRLLSETEALAMATKVSAATSHSQSTAVKEIVATMQDSTKLAESIGDKIQQVTTLARQSLDAVESGRTALQSNMDELLEIKDMNQLTISGIQELNKKISTVWEIVSIINNVADQTKIIAFNAELEASSSGEAGKNFHIVASEIRRLSDTIIDSINEIKERVDEIQHASDALILDSEKGTRQIDSGYQSAKNLELEFESIMASSEKTADSSQDILSYVGQLGSSSEQVFITLRQIADGIESLSRSTEDISSSSETVRGIASRL